MLHRVLPGAIVFLAVLLIAPRVTAGECSYGSVQAQVQDPKGYWMNATAHPVLKPGDVFHVQVRVMFSTVCQVFFLKLHEFGTPVYEVLAGPTQMEELLEFRGKTQVQCPYLYEWTIRVRPETSWIHASAPLEVFAQLNKDDSDSCVIDFDALVGAILPGGQEGAQNHQGYNGSSKAYLGRPVPGFQWELVPIAFAVLYVVLGPGRRR